ncbi:MAG: efflux RND transporter periplasmic adaptor subunit [Acidobacteria bacterium]|nr:efflux RND transporter periplasmic adaptor subunit [Acidobacteriota bacterium]
MTGRGMRVFGGLFFCALLSLLAQGVAPPAVDVVEVVSKRPERTIRLPGEFMPYLSVAVYPKVTGFLETVMVDRGSIVKKDQILARLVAPELKAQLAEAQSKRQAVEAQRVEAEAKLLAEQSTYERLKAAAATPGVVAGNDLVLAEKAVEAARARVRSVESSTKAAQDAAQAIEEIERYLEVTAPFDGVITERKVHPGALVGPAGGPGAAMPMFHLEQISRLRLVVAVPEVDLAGIATGARVSFTAPAYPAETFYGTIARPARSVDVKTRSMPVELDVQNADGRLAPGMFPEVAWPVRRSRPSLYVPPSAVVVTTERTFLIRVSQGKAEWVNVARGAPAGDLIEVFGALAAGDRIVRRGSDELRAGTPVAAK